MMSKIRWRELLWWKLARIIHMTYWSTSTSQKRTIFSIFTHSTHLFELLFTQHCLLSMRHSWQEILANLFWLRIFWLMTIFVSLFWRALTSFFLLNVILKWKEEYDKKRRKEEDEILFIMSDLVRIFYIYECDENYILFHHTRMRRESSFLSSHKNVTSHVQIRRETSFLSSYLHFRIRWKLHHNNKDK
jgi:hypothetical protein